MKPRELLHTLPHALDATPSGREWTPNSASSPLLNPPLPLRLPHRPPPPPPHRPDAVVGRVLPLFIPSPPSLSSIYYLVLSFRFAPVIFQYKIRSMRNPQ